MNKLRIDTGRPFRFPFDIDRRIFLILAVVFFVLSIKPINNIFFPRLTPAIISGKISKSFDDQYEDYLKTVAVFKKNKKEITNTSFNLIKNLNDKKWSLSIYNGDSIIFWSKSTFHQLQNQLPADSLHTFSDNGVIGIAINKREFIDGDTINFIGTFPLYIRHQVENDLFTSHFTFLTNSSQNEDYGYRLIPIQKKLENELKQSEVFIQNQARFYLAENNNFLDLTDKNFWHFFLIAVPFILFGVSIHTFFKVSVKRSPALYFSLLLLTVIVIRGMNYFLGFPDDYHEFELFNPSLYAGTGQNTSLGDMFINACLTFWILFFFIMNVQLKIIPKLKNLKATIFLIIITFLLGTSGYLTLSLIRSIIFDSHINFDTTRHEFVNTPTIFGLGTMLVIFMNYLLSVIIYKRYFNHFNKQKWLKYISLLSFLIIGYFIFDNTFYRPIVYATSWTALLLFLLSLRFFNTKFDFNSYKLIYWLIFLSFSCVLIIHVFDTQKERKIRQDYAQNLVHFENKNTEFRLKELHSNLKNDSVINQGSLEIKELQEYILKKYISIFEQDYFTSFTLRPLNKAKQKTTQHIGPAVSLINEAGKEEYLLKERINDFEVITSLKPDFGRIGFQNREFISSQVKHDKSNNNREYRFAFYENDTLVHQSSIEQFPVNLKNYNFDNSSYTNLFQKTSDIVVHSNTNENKKSVIIRKDNNTFYRISTNYAYIFTCIFLLITLYILGNIIARSNLRRKRFVNLLGLTLRMRIHLSILFVELISMSIIGLVTIYVFSNNAKQKAIENANIASKEIRSKLEQLNLDEIKKKNDYTTDHKGKINEVVIPYIEKYNVDVNIYNLHGERIFTTVSEKFASIIPNFLNPLARYKLKRNENTPTLQNESLEAIQYYTIYSYLRNQIHEKVVILETPNYSSQYIISQSNSGIITMLINVYAFVFLMSSLFAFYITKRLTKSFSKIVTQFSKINLTTTNKPLSWPYSDEIGLLIKEYNRTLRKLENSTALLAKSEREVAWREMAKQIAHEIKNPLTPMSLSLQSLRAAINRNDPNVPTLTEKMTKTVLEQINVLTRTADNFYSFAKMVDIDARKESLLNILSSSTGIYSDNDEAQFLFVLPKKDIFVFVDKVKIIRVLTNVIQNSVQSIPEERKGQIILTVTKEAKNIVKITIMDNGIGISDKLRDKIFEPNFTTKSSGSGLGLAMCKEIMLKSGGNIYFTSEENVGTEFHIEIPIYDDEKEIL